MTNEELREHFESFHHPYNEDGRVINSDEYLRLIHEEDHNDGQGMKEPHEHEEQTR